MAEDSQQNKDTMIEESEQNNTASSTGESGNAITASSMDEYRNINLSDVEIKTMDTPQVYSRFVMLLEPIVFVYALYIGALAPLSDQYVRAKIASDYNLTDGSFNESEGNLDMCNNGSSRYKNNYVDSQASLWMLYTNVASLVPGMFSLVLLGSYSDRGGRKIAIIIPLVGTIVRCLCFLAVIYFDWSLYVIVIGAFLEGLSGGISMVISAAYSYVADVTSHNRSLRMTALESCLGLGTVVSLVAIGYLIAGLGYFYPFLILAVIILLDLVIAAIFLPETIMIHPDVRFWSFGHFRKAFNLYSRDNGTGRRWKLLLSLAIVFFSCSVTLGRTDVLLIYLLDAPFCWSSVLIGYFGALLMIISAPTAVVMTKLTQPTLNDSGLLLIGTISAAAFQAVVVFSTTTVMMFMAPVAGAAYYVTAPMVRSISSKLVEQEEEGAMFATIALAIALSVLVGQLVFNNLYSATVFVWAPFTFVIMLGTLGFTTLLAVVFVIKEKLEKRSYANCDERTLLIN